MLVYFQPKPAFQAQGGVFECHLECDLLEAQCDMFFMGASNFCNLGLEQAAAGPGVSEATPDQYYKQI